MIKSMTVSSRRLNSAEWYILHEQLRTPPRWEVGQKALLVWRGKEAPRWRGRKFFSCLKARVVRVEEVSHNAVRVDTDWFDLRYLDRRGFETQEMAYGLLAPESHLAYSLFKLNLSQKGRARFWRLLVKDRPFPENWLADEVAAVTASVG
jgi:hypothetical protein